MNEEFNEKFDINTIEQINTAKKMCEEIISGIYSGTINKDLALSLLSHAKKQINTAYMQKIELLDAQGLSYDNIDKNRLTELDSIDSYVNEYLRPKTNPEDLRITNLL